MFSPRHLPVWPETNQVRRKLIQRTLINVRAHSTHWKNILILFLPRCSFEKSQSNQLVGEERVFLVRKAERAEVMPKNTM